MRYLVKIGMLMTIFSFSLQAKAEVDESPGKVAAAICSTYTDGDKMINNINKVIKMYIKVDNPTPDQIAHYLNKNLHEMTCPIYDNKGNIKDIHYMHYSVFSGMAFFSLFKEYLMDDIWMNIEDESINIDVNAVSYYGLNNTPLTVLDYMERESALLEDGDERKARLDQTIRIFIHDFKAKHFSELPKQKQQWHLERQQKFIQ